MRLMSRLVLTLGLAFAISSAATAQRPGGGFGGFGGGAGANVYSRVATSKMLAEELKITEEQKEKLQAALKPLDEKRRELFPRQGGGGQRPSEEQMRELREKMTQLSEETTKAVESVLNAEQSKRLSQINVQVTGINAFGTKKVEESLKLTDGQKEKVKTILEDYNKDVGELRRGMFQRGAGGGGDREELQKRMAEMNKKTTALTKDAMEKIEEMLKEEQKTAWSDLTGKKFDTAKFQEEAMSSLRPMRRDN